MLVVLELHLAEHGHDVQHPGAGSALPDVRGLGNQAVVAENRLGDMAAGHEQGQGYYCVHGPQFPTGV